MQVEAFEDILTCCICLDTVVAPKTLPCQHTFCKEPCLRMIIQNNNALCPMCRKTFPEPVNGFPTNYVMEKLLDLKPPQTNKTEGSAPTVIEIDNPSSLPFNRYPANLTTYANTLTVLFGKSERLLEWLKQFSWNDAILDGEYLGHEEALTVSPMTTKNFHWVKFNGYKIPDGAVTGGFTGHERLYIGRAVHQKALTIGCVLPSRNSLYLTWGSKVHIKTDFEVLVGGSQYNWVKDKLGHVPNNALVAGYTENGENTFVGRVVYRNKVVVGKIHPSHNVCYIPDIQGESELDFSEYEVLVEQESAPIEKVETPKWVQFDGYKIPHGAVFGGFTCQENLYVGTAVHQEALTPGCVLPSRNSLYLSSGSKVHIKTDFEVLVGGSKFKWVRDRSGHVPKNALVGGYAENGESIFIGRVMYKTNVLVGKIQPSHKYCYIPDIEGGIEISVSEYEVLVN